MQRENKKHRESIFNSHDGETKPSPTRFCSWPSKVMSKCSAIIPPVWQVNAGKRSTMKSLWGCCFLCRICCTDALVCKLSRRSEKHVLRVFLLVPRFSDTWSWTALIATLVCTNGMVISNSSLWPFPEFWFCFSHSFNAIRWCDWFRSSTSVNCKRFLDWKHEVLFWALTKIIGLGNSDISIFPIDLPVWL
jgi:hypothetical protein